MKNHHAVKLGTLGGKSRSKKKQLASKENGKKGGRPKSKHPNPKVTKKGK